MGQETVSLSLRGVHFQKALAQQSKLKCNLKIAKECSRRFPPLVSIFCVSDPLFHLPLLALQAFISLLPRLPPLFYLT